MVNLNKRNLCMINFKLFKLIVLILTANLNMIQRYSEKEFRRKFINFRIG